MCYAKTVDRKYIRDEDVIRVCHYILDYIKTCDDTYRGLARFDDFSGMSYMGSQLRPELCADGISLEIITQNHIYRNQGLTQAYHRIISFDRYAPVNGNDLKSLAEYLMNTIYSDFTWTYGIHMDTRHIHIHILVSAVSRSWKRFSIGNEINRIQAICNDWYDKHCDYVSFKRKDEYLYKNLM